MIRIFLTASFALMFVGAVAQSPTIRTQRNENNSLDFILENKTRPGTLTVFLTLRDLQNCNTASGTFRYETRYTGTRLLSLRPADDNRGVRYGYSYRFFLGPVDKEPDTAFVYRMPTTVRWPVRVSRGVSVYDRFRKEKKGALGLHFEMEKGDTVYAMRRGTVVEVGIPEREPDAPAVSFTSESPDLLVEQPDGTLAWYICLDGDNVLVHRDFAMQNGLSVGSTFRLRQEGRNATVRVAGIFSGNVQAQSPLPSDTSENLIYSGRRVASALTGNDRIDMIRCLSDNPQDLSAAIGRAKTMAGGKYDVTDDSARLSGVLQSVQTVRNLVRMVLLSVCLADVLVLAMALVFWIRSRIHEIGTLLALGIDKMRIVAQLAIETGLMAAVAALCSLGTGAMLSGYVSSRLLRDSGVAPLESLHVEALPPEQTMLILLLGCAVIAVALAVSCAAVLSKSPKSILSSMR